MKAISIKEPWAGLIAAGRKTIETRTWATKYRGRLLIVASLKPKTENSGMAIAAVTLKNCRPMTVEDEARACCKIYRRAVAWELTDLHTFKPFAVKGQLGIYEVPGVWT